MRNLKIGNILKDKNNNLYQILWFSKDQIYELMRLKNSSIIRLYNIDEFYYVSESIEKYNMHVERINDVLPINNHKVEYSTNEQISEGTDYYLKKKDNGKIRLGLLFTDFPKAIEEIARVATFGAIKYSDNSWKDVDNKEKRYKDALARHIIAYFDEPSGLDEESKLLHLAHVGWNVLALLQIKLTENKQNEINELMAAYEQELRK
jgi:Domain of unknown function (DUF5664)